jgi:hypothetical protein
MTTETIALPSLDDSPRTIDFYRALIKQYILLNGTDDISIDHHTSSDEGVEFILSRAGDPATLARLQLRLLQSQYYLPTGTTFYDTKVPYRTVFGIGASQQGLTHRLSIYIPYAPIQQRSAWWKDFILGVFWVSSFVILMALLYSIVVPPSHGRHEFSTPTGPGNNGGGGGGISTDETYY